MAREFDILIISDIALREKQIQQNYRPIIAVHKWFARRPGSLFRGRRPWFRFTQGRHEKNHPCDEGRSVFKKNLGWICRTYEIERVQDQSTCI